MKQTPLPSRAWRRSLAGASLALALAGGLVGTAHAVTNEASSGTQPFGTYNYSTQRYHIKSELFAYRLSSYNANCGGGNFGLRPYRVSNGNWMGADIYWGISSGSHSPGVRKTWAALNTQASGNFRLQGFHNSNCGGSDPTVLKFKGLIDY